MGIKADITGRLRARLALRHPLAPLTDMTTLLKLTLGTEVKTGTSNVLYTDTSPTTPGSDVQDNLDVFLDSLTSSPSHTAT